jgi:hypothetical protein
MRLFKNLSNMPLEDMATQDVGFDADIRFELTEKMFVEIVIKDLYERILLDCLSHTIWNSKFDYEKIQSIFYNNTDDLQQTKGLISIFTDFIYNKSLNYLKLTKENIIVIITDQEEIKVINDNIKNSIINKNVAILNFKFNNKIDLLKIYAGLLYNTLSTDNTQLYIAKAIIFKCFGLTENVALNAKDGVIKQANNVTDGLKKGKGVLIDSKSELQLPKVDTSGSKASWEQYNGLIAQTMGMPLSWVMGKVASGISATGEGDIRLIEKGLRIYFLSIWKPAIERLFNTNIKFRLETWRSLEGMKGIFEVLENTTLIDENKKKEIANDMIDGLGM